MIKAIINGIFKLIINFFNLLMSPVISLITGLFPALSSFFGYITLFLNYSFQYVGLALDLLFIPRPDLVKEAMNNKFDPVIGRDEEIKRVIEILCRKKKNNPILIGEAGVGKTALVEELSRLISINQVPNVLKNKRIISLDMSSLVAGTKYRGEFEEKLNNILLEVEDNDNIILFIDEIHTIVGAGGAEGAIDASNIFKPSLARGKLRCIGATTTLEYKKTILNDKALDRRFQRINIEEPNKETLKNILLKSSLSYSKFHKTSISSEIIDYIIDLSSKYIKNRYEPDKSLDILDEVCAHVSLKENIDNKKYNSLIEELNTIKDSKKKYLLNKDYEKAYYYKEKENEIITKINKLDLKVNSKKSIITKQDVINVVSKKSNIPLFLLSDNNTIDNIDKYLGELVLGQKETIDKLNNIYKKIKLGLKDDNMCYSMLFVGPSGVGKTYLAQLFSKKLYKNIIRLDMSEFTEPHSISKLIGSPAGYVGYDDNKNIFETIKDNPFSVLILDEIDKANRSIINLFYQILDEGYVKDAKGDTIYFNNVLIIMTSNIGYLSNNIGFNNIGNKNTELKDIFSIPFINRIDNIIYFNKLSEENIYKIINKKILNLKKKYKNRGYTIKINSSLIKSILDKSNYMEYGARKIEKIIKNELESQIIDNILDNKKIINIKNLEKEKVFI